MNCQKCQDSLVDYIENTLEKSSREAMEKHIGECRECQTLLASFQDINSELVNRAPMTADVSLEDSVMSRIMSPEAKKEPREPERISFMSRLLKFKWTLEFGALAGAALVLFLVIFSGSNVALVAAETFERGIKAIGQLKTVHLKGKIRTLPNDNFSAISADADFVDIELWKEFSADQKWKIDKTGRVAIMDGKTTILHIKPDYGYKIPYPTRSPFDTGWLHQIANISQSLRDELKAIKSNGWKNSITPENNEVTVTIEANSGLSRKGYFNHNFFSTADTKRVYKFDQTTGLLAAAKIYLVNNGVEKLVFELTQIEYNQVFASDTFIADLPENIAWNRDDEIIPDNAKYVAMNARQAAETFFEACSKEDWEEASKFYTITDSFKKNYGKIKVVKLGETFDGWISIINGAKFVPYEIKFPAGHTRKHNIALKRHPKTQRWFVDGGV